MSASVREHTIQVPVTDQEQPWAPSLMSPARSVRTVRNVEINVENMGYERLGNVTITSIPERPSLRVFKGIYEDDTFENGEDDDGEIGPFLDAVVNEADMDELYDKQPISNVEPAIETNTENALSPPPFTNDELRKMKVTELKALLTERRLRIKQLHWVKMNYKLQKDFLQLLDGSNSKPI